MYRGYNERYDHEGPLPPQPLLRGRPEWHNIGIYLHNQDLSHYEICDQGIIRDIRRPAVRITQYISDMGYRTVYLRDAVTIIQDAYSVHNLVAYIFHHDTYHPDTPVVEHIDGDIMNNRAENLRWVASTINATGTGVRVRKKNLAIGESIDYPTISACLRENPEYLGYTGLRRHLSKSMEPKMYGNTEFQRIDPLRRQRRG